MSFDRSSPSQEEIDEWFLKNPEVPPGTFELALVLGGTVSAGAYTAGALDFLIEALDCWTERRANDPTIPQHNVVLRIITGTSGGGVNAAIAARAFNFDFPSIRQSTPVGTQGTGNPFYDVWIKTLTLDRFLKNDDIADELVSVLNGGPIDDAAQAIVQFVGRGPKRRAWLAEPLRAILTVTNLYGVPYKLTFDEGLGETFVDHADSINFAVAYPGQTITAFRPDELTLGFDGASLPQASTWDNFSKFARATAAFPIGFPPRALVRPTAHYRYRVVARSQPRENGGKTQPLYDVLTPDWDALASKAKDVPTDYEFLAVDGGATDNEPIQLARMALCGLLGTNPRDADLATRAVLLIDPFAGEADLGPQRLSGFSTTLGGVASAIIQQTRYDSRDLFLAADPNIFSRFMLTPQNEKVSGAGAIASAGLSAFIGFACEDFMRYDYLLGRKNCQDFLRKTFVLSENNKLVFVQPWTAEQKAAFAKYAPPGLLPIIPLVGPAAEEQELAAWPKGKLDPEIYRDSIRARFRAIAELETSGKPILSLLGRLGAASFQYSVADYVINLMKASLEGANLD